MAIATDGDYMARIIRRIALYLGLALGAIAVCVFLVVVTAHDHVTDLGSWIFLVAYTGLLIYAAVTPFRSQWRRPSFWAATAVLVGVHLGLCISLLRYDPSWRPIWFLPIVIVEAFLFSVVLGVLFKYPTRARHRRASRHSLATRAERHD